MAPKNKTKFELFNLTQKGTPRWEKINEEWFLNKSDCTRKLKKVSKNVKQRGERVEIIGTGAGGK